MVTAYAPGSVGNVGPGLDILGLATAGRGDEVRLAWNDGSVVRVVDAGDDSLPLDADRNAAAIAATAVFSRAGVVPGVDVTVRKGLPIAGGQGGSAASAVAGAVAANALCGAGLGVIALLECALVAETAVAGRHADNLAPSLLGGLVLIRSMDPLDVVRIEPPRDMRIVLVQPQQELETRASRAVLPVSIDRATALQQAASVAAIIAAAMQGDTASFGRAIVDQIAEPVRAAMLPGFMEAKRAALATGAYGCSISGAGPTCFAICDDDGLARDVADAMVAAYDDAGVNAMARITVPDLVGARIT